MKITVSLIIPVYNAEKTLDRCIESIQSQTFTDWEIILIDDGSQDKSADICDKYAISDTRIHVFHQKNGGVSSARNTGIRTAKGQYLMFIDSDDTIEVTFLADYIAAIQSMKADVVVGGYTLIDKNEKKSVYYPSPKKVFHNEIWEEICKDSKPFGYMWNKIFKRDIITQYQLTLREDMYSQEDLDFCLSYLEQCSTFGMIENIDYQYYYVEGKRIPPVWNFVENQLKLFRIAQAKKQLSDEAIKAVEQRVVLLIFVFFYDAERNGTFREAVKHLDKVEGLQFYLKNISVHDEKSFICHQYLKKRYRFIYRYFKFRRAFRNVIQKIR